MKIRNHSIGTNHPTYIIAEMSANHGGQLSKAKEIMKAIKNSGANAVKLQTYTANSITLNTDKNDFILREKSKWQNHKTLFELFSVAHTPYEWLEELFYLAHKIDLDIFSSPFDEEAVDLLESFNTPAYKVASPEVNHIPLLKKIAKTGKPVIISSGLATLEDLTTAVKTLINGGSQSVAILKCTTQYPAESVNLNLRNIVFLRDKFDIPVGFSDHSLGGVAALGAVALGANIIEKHFCLDSNEDTVDSFFSMGEKDFTNLVRSIRELEKSLGSVEYTLPKMSIEDLNSRRSIYASSNIKKGEKFSKDNVKCVRPGYGLDPRFYEELIGLQAKRNLEPGDRIEIIDLE
jgi:pseudaminic acid synthase